MGFPGIALDLADKDMQNVKGIISDAPNVSIRELFEKIKIRILMQQILLFCRGVTMEMGCISKRNCIKM